MNTIGSSFMAVDGERRDFSSTLMVCAFLCVVFSHQPLPKIDSCRGLVKIELPIRPFSDSCM